MSDDLKVFIICVLFNVLGVIFMSIKDKENVPRNLKEFFKDWWYVIKTAIIPLFLILLFCALIGWVNS